MTMMLKRVNSQQPTVDSPTSQIENPNSDFQHPTSNSRIKRSLFWLLYIVATIAMLYTQYVGAFVVVAENIAFVVWFVLAIRDQIVLRPSSSVIRPPSFVVRPAKRSSVKHSLAFWLIGQLVIGSLFLPWYCSRVGNSLRGPPSVSHSICRRFSGACSTCLASAQRLTLARHCPSRLRLAFCFSLAVERRAMPMRIGSLSR